MEEITIDKETGVNVERGQEIIAMIALEVEKEVEIEMDGHNLGLELCQMTEDQGLDLILEYTQTGTDKDAIGVVNMTTLPKSALIH